MLRGMDPSQLNPTGRFSDRVDDYVRYRPTYPAAAVLAALDGAPPGPIVDVGAGTGIWTALLASQGREVLALEPNAEMRAAAPALPRVTWQGGTAESTGLATASAAVITVAQAFHWFRAREALEEFGRVLVPGGRLALVWNRRSRTDPFTAGYREAVLSVGAETAAEMMPFDPQVFAQQSALATPELQTFPHEQELDRAGLHGRARSASYVPKEGPRAEELGARLDALFDRFEVAGSVRLVYDCEVWTSSRR
jgi:SAM-dependent methyltransferase